MHMGLGCMFGGEGKEEKSDAAQEAISDEMGKAMMMYTPLAHHCQLQRRRRDLWHDAGAGGQDQ